MLACGHVTGSSKALARQDRLVAPEQSSLQAAVLQGRQSVSACSRDLSYQKGLQTDLAMPGSSVLCAEADDAVVLALRMLMKPSQPG